MPSRTEAAQRKLRQTAAGRLTPLRLFSTLLAKSYVIQAEHLPPGLGVSSPDINSYPYESPTVQLPGCP